MTVSAGAALGGTLSIANSVGINLSATIAPGTSGVAGSLTVGSLTLNGGSNYNWKMTNAAGTAGSGYDTIAATAITIGSGAVSTPINIDASILDPSFNSAASGQWTLASSTGAITLPTMPNTVTASNLFNAFTPSNVFGNFSVTVTGASNNNLTLNYTPVSLQTLTWQGGAGTWQPAATAGDTAWNNGVSNGPFSLSSIAEFASGSGGGTVTLGNNVSAAVIRFDTTGYTIAGGASNFTLSDAPSSGVPSLDVQVTNAGDSATISAAIVSPLTKFGAGTLVSVRRRRRQWQYVRGHQWQSGNADCLCRHLARRQHQPQRQHFKHRHGHVRAIRRSHWLVCRSNYWHRLGGRPKQQRCRHACADV